MNGHGVVPGGLSFLENANLIPLDTVEYQSDLAPQRALSSEKESCESLLTSFLFLAGTECLQLKIEIHSGFLFLHFQILIISDSLFNPRERPPENSIL